METEIKISVNGRFSWKECLWYLDRGYDDCIYRVYPQMVRRAIQINGKKMLIEIGYRDGGIFVKWLVGDPDTSEVEEVRRFVTEWFDLEVDLLPFYSRLEANPALAYMAIDFSGLRFIGMPDLFESLAWCIIGQQINLNFAYKVKRSFVEKYGSCMEFEQQRFWIFPAPDKIAALDVSELRELQFSNKKAEYLIEVAKNISAGLLSKKMLAALPDLPSKQKTLTSIRGIGIWTSNYVLMKSLRERSCIPYGDAGVLNALIAHAVIDTKTDTRSADIFFSGFSQWESYMVFYFWRSLAIPAHSAEI